MSTKIKKNGKDHFLTKYDEIVKEIKAGTLLTPNGDKYKRGSLYNYKVSRRHLQMYEALNGQILLKHINHDWMESYRLYLMDKGLAKNTISQFLNTVKAVLKRLNKSGFSKFDGSGVRSGTEITTAVYNSVDELRHMAAEDLSHTPGLEKVRDIYVLHCYIGVRWADLKTLLQNLDRYIITEAGYRFIQFKSSKTGSVVTIPIGSIAEKMFDRCGYSFLPMFSYQHYNKYIKKLGAYFNLTGEVVHTRTSGGRRVDKVINKYLLMSSHTARRSFATNAYLAGVPILSIMAITGHKTQSSFLRYIRCEALESAINIADHSFFNPI